MKKIALLTVALAVPLLTTSVAVAARSGSSYKVSAALTAKAEVPAPKGSSGKGTFTGTYVENSKGGAFTWKLSFSGLTGPATAAHIHMGKTGVAGAVIVPLCSPCKTSQSGQISITKATIATLESGGAYVNVHTAKNPNGEIRGQVKVKG